MTNQNPADYIPIGYAAALLGKSNQTLIRWHKTGKLIPDHIDQYGARWYLKESLKRFTEDKP